MYLIRHIILLNMREQDGTWIDEVERSNGILGLEGFDFRKELKITYEVL
jgi:hypothetical protein